LYYDLKVFCTYRAWGSRVALRCVNFYFEKQGNCKYQDWDVTDRAIYEVYQTLVWAALAGIFEPAAK
jgi:hypothetical protein